jgi:hypothetical protein
MGRMTGEAPYFAFFTTYEGDEIKEDEMGGTCIWER